MWTSRLGCVFVALAVATAVYAQAQKQWKDRAEYDLAKSANQAGPRNRVAILVQWARQYPQSDYADTRENLYLITFQQLQDPRRFDTASEILLNRPNDYLALSAIMGGISQINPPRPSDLDAAEAASRYLVDYLETVFAEGNNPPTIPADQYQSMKQPTNAFAQRTLGYVLMKKRTTKRRPRNC